MSMIMTDEQRYSAVLKELGEVLQSKNTTISCQTWQIDQLKEKLAAAEEERDLAKKDCEAAIEEMNIANAQLFDALEVVKRLKGGAA